MPRCETCGEQHLDRYGRPGCPRHVINDRDSYVKGQPRKPLDKPRPCRRATGDSALCTMHGGAGRQVKGATSRRQQNREAEKIMRRFGEPVDTTPTDALLDAVKWTAGYVNWLREKVGPVDGDDLTDEAALTEFSKTSGKREANAWVDLLGQWHDRLVKICTDAIKAGIEERRVRIAEQQGALVASAIRDILNDLALTPDQLQRAGEVVPLRLRALAAAA